MYLLGLDKHDSLGVIIKWFSFVSHHRFAVYSVEVGLVRGSL